MLMHIYNVRWLISIKLVNMSFTPCGLMHRLWCCDNRSCVYSTIRVFTLDENEGRVSHRHAEGCVCVCVHAYVNVCVCMLVCVHAYLSMYLYVCVHTCVCVCVLKLHGNSVYRWGYGHKEVSIGLGVPSFYSYLIL